MLQLTEDRQYEGSAPELDQQRIDQLFRGPFRHCTTLHTVRYTVSYTLQYYNNFMSCDGANDERPCLADHLHSNNKAENSMSSQVLRGWGRHGHHFAPLCSAGASRQMSLEI